MAFEDLQIIGGADWYKDAIIYELHIRSFYDGNGDGIGDFPGATKKLDYLADLGVTALWLLPFYPSPLKDDGYDITNYLQVHPSYGDLKSFHRFLKEAHRRGIRVITELVINHTSDQHPWFQRARRAKPGSAWRNFYVWSDSPEKYSEARIIFQDFEASNWTWDPVAKAYYWHRFYSHQPDLNYDNPLVHKAMLRIIDFWLEMGVDGMRVDAVPYLYEREGTNCENLPETHQFLKKLRSHMDEKFAGRMLLAEANQWPEDAAVYFGNGNECNMAFHFPLMPRMFMALQMENRFPILDIMDQTPKIPEGCQWALFLRNHDELTLEMVTDEERDYMYKVYARDPRAKINLGIRRRLAPLMGNNRRKMELMNILLFSLPGTPVIYYGDEIGMGDNYYLGDRNGVRTPMQWDQTINAGFSDANPQELYLPVIIDPQYHYATVNVANQDRDRFSYLWWMRQSLALRKKFRAFGRGDLKFLPSGNPKVLAFIRRYKEEILLVVANLSRYPQHVDLDLSEHAGYIPEEAFGKNSFSIIDRSPYSLTLGPYDYYWFSLQQEKAAICIRDRGPLNEIEVGGWEKMLEDVSRDRLEELLPAYMQCCGWWFERSRAMQGVRIIDVVPISRGSLAYLLILEISYVEGLSDLYLLPLSLAFGENAEKIKKKTPQAVIARFRSKGRDGVLYDGIYDEELRSNLLSMILHSRRSRGEHGELVFRHAKDLPGKHANEALSSTVLLVDSSVTQFQFQDIFFLKLFRHLEEGVNYGLKLTKFLTERGFPFIPSFEGEIEYLRKGFEPISIGMLQAFIPNQGDAWQYSLDEAGRYFERVLSRREALPKAPASLMDIRCQSMPPLLQDLMGRVYLEMIGLLGKRTAEMHLTLASSEDPEFEPEPYSSQHQRALYQSMRVALGRAFQILTVNLTDLSDDLKGDATTALSSRKELLAEMKKVVEGKITGMRIKIHGDYRLGQVLYTGKDFLIFGFQSRPEHILAERRMKRSPLVDVASMIHSFRSAAYRSIMDHTSVRPEDQKLLEPWGELWWRYLSGIFLSSYLRNLRSELQPEEKVELEMLLNLFLLDRAIRDLGTSLEKGTSPAIPLRVLKSIISGGRIIDESDQGQSPLPGMKDM
jgi:maltose alpha-D-glucosyltransferase/alpha-amylase